MAAPASGSKRSLPVDAAAAERRVQPRHFNAGPSPVAASDSHAAAASADGPSPAAMLYRHALECVFAFLCKGELAFALRVSRGWLSAAQSMASLQLEVEQPAADLRVVAASAIGRHVAVLGGADFKSVSLDIETLSVVARLMPHLRGLFCQLAPPPFSQPPSFPAALRQLEIDQRFSDISVELNATLKAVGCLSRLESFTILLSARPDPQISFAPLVALPRLRHLEIRALFGPREFSDAQADQLRALPQLRELDVDITTRLLRRLLRPPHDLRWQRISLPDPFDDEVAALLLQLPSLTEIDAVVGCERVDWLRGLPNLRRVDFDFEGADQTEDIVESLVAGLQCCSNIEILLLHDCRDLTAAHLANLLPRLPRLRELHLDILTIESLSFLTQPPMTIQLSTLMLAYCKQLPPAELDHVQALRGLKTLELWCSFTAPLDDSCRSLYEPPSLLLPRLEKFSYSAPEEEDDESEVDEPAEDEPDDGQ